MKPLTALRLLTMAFRDSWVETIGQPLESLATVVMTAFWSGWAVAGVSYFYHYGPVVAGWTEAECYAVLGCFLMVNGFRLSFVQPAVRGLSNWVTDGSVDPRLARPASPSVLLYVTFMRPTSLVELLSGAGLVAYAMCAQPGLTVWHVISFCWMYLVACAFVHSLGLASRAVVLRVHDNRPVDGVMAGAMETARYPRAFYASAGSWLVTVLFGTVFATNEPARAALGLSLTACLVYTAAVVGTYVACRSIWSVTFSRTAVTG